MINLIPDDIKLNTRFALKNQRLVRYMLISLGTMIAILVITGLTIFTMFQTRNNLRSDLDIKNGKINDLKPIEASGEKLFAKITTINELLNRQVKFSDILPQLGSAIPPNTVLIDLSLTTSDIVNDSKPKTTTTPATGVANSTAVNKPLIIRARAKDRSLASTFLENIKKKTDLFSSADLITISYSPVGGNGTGTTTGGEAGETFYSPYPWLMQINVYVNKKKPTTMIDPGNTISLNTIGEAMP